MRKNIGLLTLLAIPASILLFQACLKDTVSTTYKIYTPVYTLKSTVLAGINSIANQPINKAGQLYIKDKYIYLNEPEKGIHVIDNSDPTHPSQIAFLSIPGNDNVAIRGNILYADMYNDLLAIDITDPRHTKVVGSLHNAFPNRSYSADSNYIISKWNIHDTVIHSKVDDHIYYGLPNTDILFLSNVAPAAAQSAANAATTGTAGSTATMALVGNYLYAVPEAHTLGIVSLADPNNPAFVKTMYAGFDLETIFPLRDNLLLGSMTGVYIYSLTDPAAPTQIGMFSHGRSCDPVIADNTNAYVTLRSGTRCGSASNELDVLDATDLTKTTLLKTYAMNKPSGLGKDGNTLFICDSPSIRIFDATNPTMLQQLSTLPVTNAYDLIAGNKHLIVASKDGLYQYDYSDPAHPALLSRLAIQPTANE
jgi:hypothetical protein